MSFEKLEAIIKARIADASTIENAVSIATLGTLADLMLDVVRAAEATYNRQTDYQARWAMEDIATALESLRTAQDKLP